MLSFKQNIDVSNDTLGYLRELSNTDALEREIATTLLASNLERIHQDGKAVNGEEIGQYTPFSKEVRQNPQEFGLSTSSRQVEYVDLFFSGKLQKDFVMAPASGGWGLGFQTSYGSRLRAKHEKKFNKQIWGISAADDETINRIVSAFILNPRSGFIS